uniref:Uncharacterized protein n=1 Tax=Anguilla anguilla TaxID=7936 RepID=A0A0E9WYB2_ANGAN
MQSTCNLPNVNYNVKLNSYILYLLLPPKQHYCSVQNMGFASFFFLIFFTDVELSHSHPTAVYLLSVCSNITPLVWVHTWCALG